MALPDVLESTYFLSSRFFLSYFLMTKSKYDSRWRGFGQIRNQRGAAKGLRPAGKIQHSSSLSLAWENSTLIILEKLAEATLLKSKLVLYFDARLFVRYPTTLADNKSQIKLPDFSFANYC